MDLVTERESSNALRSRAKRFLFYLAAIVVGPVVMLLVVEGFLRLVARGPEHGLFRPDGIAAGWDDRLHDERPVCASVFPPGDGADSAAGANRCAQAGWGVQNPCAGWICCDG